MSTGKTVLVKVSDVKFDPDDELTPRFKKTSVVYYVYLNDSLIGQSSASNDFKDQLVSLTPKVLADYTNVIRVIARDHGVILQNQEYGQVGTISINMEYFDKLDQSQEGKQFNQWITLFDDTSDDEYDGDFDESDNELPMIKTQFTIQKAVAPSRRLGSPKTSEVKRQIITNGSPNGTNDYNSVPNSTIVAALGSPGPGVTKRKTVVMTADGLKKIVNTEDLLNAQSIVDETKLSSRRGKKQMTDVFGVFFGIESNPPGTLNKGSQPVNFKGEKEKFI
jgi:hypothetical protein